MWVIEAWFLLILTLWASIIFRAVAFIWLHTDPIMLARWQTYS